MARAKRRKKAAPPPKKKAPPRRRFIDPRTGKPFRNPTVAAAESRGEKLTMKQDPVTGRILPGNPTAYRPGQPKSGPGRQSMLSHSYRHLLQKTIPNNLRKKLYNNDKDVKEFCDGLALRVATIALTGGERYAILAAAEIRAATEGTRIQHAKEDWKEELAALGLDPDEAMGRIETLLTEMVDEADERRRLVGGIDGEGGEESSDEEAGKPTT